MTAIRAGDKHYLGEFGSDPRDERPVRFEGVVNPAEIAEDMAVAVVPTQA